MAECKGLLSGSELTALWHLLYVVENQMKWWSRAPVAPLLQNQTWRHTGRTSSSGALRQHPNPSYLMLSWTLTFIVVALIAGVLGFGALAGAAATVAQVCFVIFLILFVLSLIRGKKSI